MDDMNPYRIVHCPKASRWHFRIVGSITEQILYRCETLEDALRKVAQEYEEAADFAAHAPWMTSAILDVPIEAVSNRRAGIPQS